MWVVCLYRYVALCVCRKLEGEEQSGSDWLFLRRWFTSFRFVRPAWLRLRRPSLGMALTDRVELIGAGSLGYAYGTGPSFG